MSKIVWDKTGDRTYETGVKQCVLYVQNPDGSYPQGVAWNGITAVTESPSGAEASAFYADDIKYLNLRSAEDFGGTIEAYTYPEEFGACNGEAALAEGVIISQQKRRAFGLCYRTILGNDTEEDGYGYKLHFVYGCTASPSEKAYATVGESPEPIAFSWEFTTNPVTIEGYKPTACLVIDSTKVDAAKLASLEAIIYGSDDTEARMPLPSEIAEIFAAG